MYVVSFYRGLDLVSGPDRVSRQHNRTLCYFSTMDLGCVHDTGFVESCNLYENRISCVKYRLLHSTVSLRSRGSKKNNIYAGATLHVPTLVMSNHV